MNPVNHNLPKITQLKTGTRRSSKYFNLFKRLVSFRSNSERLNRAASWVPSERIWQVLLVLNSCRPPSFKSISTLSFILICLLKPLDSHAEEAKTGLKKSYLSVDIKFSYHQIWRHVFETSTQFSQLNLLCHCQKTRK